MIFCFRPSATILKLPEPATFVRIKIFTTSCTETKQIQKPNSSWRQNVQNLGSVHQFPIT